MRRPGSRRSATIGSCVARSADARTVSAPSRRPRAAAGLSATRRWHSVVPLPASRHRIGGNGSAIRPRVCVRGRYGAGATPMASGVACADTPPSARRGEPASVGILPTRMRIAVLSDIHANLPALEAVRADLTDVDQVWVLGDIVGYGPQPNEVIAILQEMGARSVLGNHDGAAIGDRRPRVLQPRRARRDRVDGDGDRRQRPRLPGDAAGGPARRRPHRRARLAARPDLGVHHQPRRSRPRTSSTSRRGSASSATRTCRSSTASSTATSRRVPGLPGEVVRLGRRRALLNPGSVGQPRDGLPDAAYAVLETGERRRAPT